MVCAAGFAFPISLRLLYFFSLILPYFLFLSPLFFYFPSISVNYTQDHGISFPYSPTILSALSHIQTPERSFPHSHFLLLSHSHCHKVLPTFLHPLFSSLLSPFPSSTALKRQKVLFPCRSMTARKEDLSIFSLQYFYIPSLSPGKSARKRAPSPRWFLC